MSWIPRIFRRDKLYNDLSEEMRLHLEERTEQLIAEGMSWEEAERAARRTFGNRTLIEEKMYPVLALLLCYAFSNVMADHRDVST